MKRSKPIVALALLGVLFPSIFPLLAFNPNYLISDEELTDATAMSLRDIETFLRRGYLGEYETENHEGEEKTAAEIIYDAAIAHQMSPRFLLVLLQKEQSLIEDDDPTQKQLDWATGYGICDVCTTTTESAQRWKGFGKQVNSAAMQFRDGYLADIEAYGKTVAGYGPGIRTTIDDVHVTPQNAATAALYTYTPHLHGNENFVALWTNYFTQNYPSGSLLQARGEDGVWLIKYGERRPITSRAALVSRYNPDNIIQVDASTLLQYDIGDPIAFPNYSLLRNEEGKIYLIVDDERRWIRSMEAFRAIGFNEDEVIDVTDEDLDAYDVGASITEESADPKGHLLQNSTTGGVYFVADGIKHPLLSRTILDLNFKDWAIVPTAPELLETYETGDPVKLAEGTLVKADDTPAVYVISDSKRRPILSGEVFETLGYSWENIVVTDAKTVNLHELGESIEIEVVEDDLVSVSAY